VLSEGVDRSEEGQLEGCQQWGDGAGRISTLESNNFEEVRTSPFPERS